MSRTERAGPPLVSVVVAFLDAEPFLDEAVRSVLDQSYQRWELLLVDDGSRDGGTEIARRYAELDPGRIHYLDHPGHRNLGTSAARQLGLSHARGKYLALLDGDDVWFPEKLERQVALLEAHPHVALLVGAPLYWFGWTHRPEDEERDYVIDLRLPAGRVYDPPDLLLPYLRLTAPPPCPSDVLIRLDAARSVGGFESHFTGERLVYEDYAFFCKVLLRYPAYLAAETWDYYRQRSDSCYAVAKATGSRELARRYFLRWFRDHLERQGRATGPVWREVREELRAFSFTGRMFRRARGLIRRVVPAGLRTRIAARLPGGTPPRVRFGDLRRLGPFSRHFGWDRGGLPVDRHYIERFLGRHGADITGRVLEVRDDTYTRRFGGDRVVRSDVLHPVPGHPGVTIVEDLTDGRTIPDDAFDCIILTQVLPFIPDPAAAIRTIHRALRPGGVVLATLPGISQIVRYDMDAWGDYWRFTSLSARRLFETAFPASGVDVRAHGNVLAATAFLYGLSSAELDPEELAHSDPDYEVLISVRAVKEGIDG